MAVVMDDDFVADAFHIHAWTLSAEWSQANRDSEDAVFVRANRDEWRDGVVDRQRGNVCRDGPLLDAAGKAQRPRCTEKGSPVHGATVQETDAGAPVGALMRVSPESFRKARCCTAGG